MADRGKAVVKLGSLVGGLATVGPIVVIVVSVAIVVLAVTIVIVVRNDHMAINFERLLAILMGRDVPTRGNPPGGARASPPPPPPSNGNGSHSAAAVRKRWPRRLGRRRNGSGQ